MKKEQGADFCRFSVSEQTRFIFESAL